MLQHQNHGDEALRGADQSAPEAAETSHPLEPLIGSRGLSDESPSPPMLLFDEDEDLDGKSPPEHYWKKRAFFFLQVHYQKVFNALPSSAQRYLGLTLQWIQGPENPRPFTIRPLLRIKFLERIMKSGLAWLILILFSTVYLVVFVAFLGWNVSSCNIPGYGEPLRLSCVSRPWRGSAECGLNGLKCRPFHSTSYAFRCPADCRSVHVLEPYTIGNTEINYQSLVIGGRVGNDSSSAPLYRGDSFICSAAIHAGIISDFWGGPGVIKLVGEQSQFVSTNLNGIESIAFAPSFPLAFSFELEAAQKSSSACSDPRAWLILLTACYHFAFSFLTDSASVFFGIVFSTTYFCVALAADAPRLANYYKVVSLAFQGFLPAAFVGYAIYKFCIRSTLHKLLAPIEKQIFWLVPFWIGALDNLTFDRLPLQRLTPHDLTTQPGAIPTLVVIVLLIASIAVGQVWAFRIEGRLGRYLMVYLALASLLIFLLIIPNVYIRLHHYIIALLLLPGTAIQTRPSLLYQGLLVGLFINGIARWGFDSIVQVSSDLFATDSDGLVPNIQKPSIADSTISFAWNELVNAAYDSLSIVVNDVERYRGYEDHAAQTFTWRRNDTNEDTFFRFGYVKYGRTGDSEIGKYSHPGIWLKNGTWIPPQSEAG